ncbi:MAG TPA: TerB family tellurite resistance protein [Nitrospirae bacterium]|nr:tellurite resistance protein TerB [bacterium BMS3Abin09]GBE41803.1 tellurite resistance protein TerB [bacterium BMS3Bbin09]HDH34412.1 TerB family tellurite resistance protein [Nitrospirota bacterium]HDN95314.1 TerB family tellurite resistance protein [Nitrospirota bacterium]HDZ84754.1 TerB family tellurite resistance protein [Nitrospirota bacterium]
MVNIIKQFFGTYVKPSYEDKDNVSEHALQIATAALLIEMMRADTDISAEEEEKVNTTIRSRFKLTGEETAALIELAGHRIWEATGYFEFTSLMNKGFSYEQKIKVIEHLWEIAYVDGILDKYEEYMVRKIADLIYVSHKDFIDAKLRVKKQTVM